MEDKLKQFFQHQANDDLAYSYEDLNFSRLMLNEHFDQSTNNASRKSSIISDEILLIQDVLPEKYYPSILDVGCGPGFHIEKLNSLGYRCDGIDVSPMAIEEAGRRNPTSDFYLTSINSFTPTKEYDAVLVLYGLLTELDELDSSMQAINRSLRAGGMLLIELMKPEFIDKLAAEPVSVSHRDEPSCFSDHRHIRVTKRFQDEARGCLVNRSLVLDSAGEFKVNESHFYRYDFEQMKLYLQQVGFVDAKLVTPPLSAPSLSKDYFYISAQKGVI